MAWRRVPERIAVSDPRRCLMSVVRQWRRHSLGHGWDAGCAVSGQVFRPLNLTDEFTCQALGIDIDSLPAERLCLLDQVKAWRALPMTIRVDNGPEFVAEARADWVSGTACCGASSPRAAPEQPLDRAVQQEFPGTHPRRLSICIAGRGPGCRVDVAARLRQEAIPRRPAAFLRVPTLALPTRNKSDHAFEAESSLRRINGCGDARRADPFG